MPYVRRRHAEAESDNARERFAGYMREVPCLTCNGARLKPSLAGGDRQRAEHRRGGRPRIDDLAVFMRALELTEREAQIAERVVKEINERLRFLLDVGLDYLTPVPARRQPLRRRGAAHPARHPDRLRPGRRALRARRAVHRAAPARQPPADRDPAPAARPRQHPDRGRARRGHDPRRRLGGRHRPGAGEHGGAGGGVGSGERTARPPDVAHRRVPVRTPIDPDAGPAAPGHRQGDHRARGDRAQPARRHGRASRSAS